jgi:hypothetical protein
MTITFATEYAVLAGWAALTNAEPALIRTLSMDSAPDQKKPVTVFGVFVLRLKQPQCKRPFKAWGYPVTPALHLLLNGWMLCYLLIERPLPSVAGLLAVGSALLLCKILTNTSAIPPHPYDSEGHNDV